MERLSSSTRDGLAAWHVWWQALLPARRPALAGLVGMAMLVLLFFVTALRHSPTANHSILPAPRKAAATPGPAVQPEAITPANSFSPNGGRIWTATPDAAQAMWVRRESNGNWRAVASSADGSPRIADHTYAYDSSVAWVDYDNEGRLNILLTGGTTDSGGVSRDYRNNAGRSTWSPTPSYAYDAIGRVVVHENKAIHRSAGLSKVQATNLIANHILSNNGGTNLIRGGTANQIEVSTNAAFPWRLDQSNAPTYWRAP